MKFTCERPALYAAASTSARAAKAKSSVPVLEGLLIETTNSGTVRVTGHDQNTAIISEFPADVYEAGSIVLNARLFCEMLRRMAGDSVLIALDTKMNVKIECATSNYKIVGLPATDFPPLPSTEGKDAFRLHSHTLRDMINQTIFAVSDSESRPMLTGVLFDIESGGLTTVASDSHRLALRKETLEPGSEELFMSFVVPGAALSEAERIAAQEDDAVEIVVGEKHVTFKMEKTTLISRLLEGEFLNYKAVLPQGSKFSVAADRRDLVSAVERVSLIIDEKIKSPVRCVFGDGVLSLRSLSAVGEASDECGVSGDGENLEVGFNSRYLLDALRAAPSDRVILRLTTSTTPCVIIPEDDEEYYLYLVLPVRLPSDG